MRELTTGGARSSLDRARGARQRRSAKAPDAWPKDYPAADDKHWKNGFTVPSPTSWAVPKWEQQVLRS